MTTLSINDVQLPPPKSWDTLEAMLRDLLRMEWNDFHAQRNGRRGQAQQGVDVFGRPGSGPGWVGVQCKNKDLLLRTTLTVKELRQEVHKAKTFVPRLRQFIVATTAPRDARIQEEARKITDRHRKAKLFSVHVYAWDDVQDLMAKHDTVAKQYYGSLWPQNTAAGPLLSAPAVQATFSAPPTPTAGQETQEATVHVLSVPATQVLGLLATSPLSFPQEAYAQLFPATDWAALLPELLAAKVVTQSDGVIGVRDAVKARILPTDAARHEFLDAWIAALEPLAEHVDMALFLALQYVARGNPVRAVEALTGVAAGLERGLWNNEYAAILGAFDKPKLLRRLSATQRREYLSAYGLCLARANKPAEARACARRLLTVSTKAGDHEGVAQAFLLFGLAYQYLGEEDRAASSYDRTAVYGQKHGVPLLVGHALHNLAMLKAETDPAEAGRILDRSVEAKKQAGDEEGKVGALFGRGSLAAAQGQYPAAFTWYSRAERQAAKRGMQHIRALSLCNMGTALLDQGEPRAALKHYRSAEATANREGYPDALGLAVGGAAKAYVALHRFAKAEERFRRLREVHRDTGDTTAEVVALHDVGVCLLKQRKVEEARTVLSSAYDDAVMHGLTDWIYRCAKDIALTHLTSNGYEQAASALRTAAAREAASGRHGVCAGLWECVASVLAEHAPASPEIERAFRSALAEAELAGQPPEEWFRLVSGLYQHLWDSGHGPQALEALRSGLRLAREANNPEYRCRFSDQLGMCLQQLGDPSAAVPAHRAALRTARSLPATELVENCLNNLGEALRKTGRSAEAVPLFAEAEAIARGREDQESELSVAHNRALALEDLGQRSRAEAILRRCRDISLQLECWDQFVRALHALANHAWLRSKTDEAEDLYRQALAAAKKHRVPEQTVMIAINYANAIRVGGRPKHAFRMLLAVRGAVSTAPDAWEYHFALGAAAHEAGEPSVAIAAYEAALRAARAAGAAEESTQGAISLAECLLETGQHDRAREVITTAFATETVGSRKVSLLTTRLKLLLSAGQRPQAGRVFALATRLAEAEGMKEDLVDLHMMLGDHDWDRGKSKMEALKAYVAALIPACDISVEVMVQTGAHAVRQLLNLPEGHRADQIEGFLAKLKPWLKRQVAKKDYPNAERLLLWPLRVALRVARSRQDVPAIPDRTWTRYVAEELLGSA